jgi:hypothetical protein
MILAQDRDNKYNTIPVPSSPLKNNMVGPDNMAQVVA